MVYAVALPFDEPGHAAVAALWRRLSDAGLSTSMPELGYPAHLTLAVHDSLDPSVLVPRFDDLVARHAPLDVTFAELDCFAGPPAVLWLAPQPAAALRALQAAVLDLMPPNGHPHYRRDTWVPHCSLATDLSAAALAEARALLAPAAGPLRVGLSCLELVRFPPVDTLWRGALTGSPGVE